MVQFINKWVGVAASLFPIIAVLALLQASEVWWFTFAFIIALKYQTSAYLARQEHLTMTALMAAIQDGSAKVTKIEVPQTAERSGDVDKAGD